MEQVLVAAAGGFLGWCTMQVVAYLVMRRRLLTFLSVHVNTYLEAVIVNKKWLVAMAERHCMPGAVFPIGVRYQRGNASESMSCQEMMLKYLHNHEIQRMAKFMAHLDEFEYLAEGVCTALHELAEKKASLTDEDRRYVLAKVDRVSSIVERWPASIKHVSDLPNDYIGVRGPESIPSVARPGGT